MTTKLQRYLDAKGIKHKWFADRIGISTATLHHILKGHHLPTLVVAVDIENLTHNAITVHDWYNEYQIAKETQPEQYRFLKRRGTKIKDY